MPLTPRIIELHKRAASYVARRREVGWTGADERELNAWLVASPEHRALYDELSRTARELASLDIDRSRWASDPLAEATPAGQGEGADGIPSGRPAVVSEQKHGQGAAEPMAGSATAIANARAGSDAETGSDAATGDGFRQGQAAARGRRRALVPALLGVAGAVAAGGWFWREQRAVWRLDAATAAGETRELPLVDGSRVTLNVATRLRVAYDRQTRAIELARGEAFFEVASDRDRPLIVSSGASRVRVVGTAFNVRAGPSAVVVKVLEGKVDVFPDWRTRPTEAVRLSAGTGVSIDPASGRPAAIAVQRETVGDWRGGQVVFQQTPLRDVAAELARYLDQPVRIDGGPRLAALPVSGMLVTSAPKPFLLSLPHLLPVRVTPEPGGGWSIAAR